MVAFGRLTRVGSWSNLNPCSMNGVRCKGSARVEPSTRSMKREFYPFTPRGDED